MLGDRRKAFLVWSVKVNVARHLTPIFVQVFGFQTAIGGHSPKNIIERTFDVAHPIKILAPKVCFAHRKNFFACCNVDKS